MQFNPEPIKSGFYTLSMVYFIGGMKTKKQHKNEGSKLHAERLLNLAAFLLNTSTPVSLSIIQDKISGYKNDNPSSAARKFERDKEELAGLGLPLAYEEDEFGEKGYFINRDEYLLPEVELEPTEAAALSLCLRQKKGLNELFPDASLARQKIFLLSPPLAGNPQALALEKNYVLNLWWNRRPEMLKKILNPVYQAMSNRKFIEMSYYSIGSDKLAKRKVNPLGLMLRAGNWYLAAWCHLRKEVRLFRLDRIKKLTINKFKPKQPDFEIPKDFTMAHFIDRSSWDMANTQPVNIRIRFSPRIAWQVKDIINRPVKLTEQADGSSEMEIKAAWPEGVILWVLGFKGEAEIIAPESVRQDVKTMLNKIIDKYKEK